VKVAKGFFWAGVQAGIKPNRKDLALVYSDVPCAAAGCFTQNLAKAAPVLDAEHRLPADGIRAVVINSGNANALTGPEGLEDVKTVREAIATELNVSATAILSASTGVIGVRMPAHKIVANAPALVASLKPDVMGAAEAILTTDTRVKLGSRVVRIDDKEVTLTCICKGSGMIAPSLATMIAVVATDCAITPPMLSSALRQAMRRSFNALTVDGDMSTNDCVFALANGASGVTIAERDMDLFVEALRQVCEPLAVGIVRGGEGATKLVTIEVTGGASNDEAKRTARAIANSPLVKTAVHGADPNWGRLVAVMGRAGVAFDLERARVQIGDVELFAAGRPFDERAPRASDHLQGPEVTLRVDLGTGGSGTARMWTCDLSAEYVKINAEYRT